MPIGLSQLYSPADRTYEDAEFALYDYPKIYFSRIETNDRFIYYRPRGRGAQRADAMHYFGHGTIGRIIADPLRSDHRFADLDRTARFPRLVPIRDFAGLFFETESAASPPFQSAVRRISETAYYRILSEARVTAATVAALPSVDDVSAFYLPPALAVPPRDPFRRIERIPPGAGYVPRETDLNVYESAALQERARADHQRVLALVAGAVHERGGYCAYNNNVDLYADFGTAGVLVEAKSLTDLRDTVDRMRYGLGQLADYGFRYKAELRGATPVLAFGRAPDRQTAWVADILEENGVGFIAARPKARG
jgi:hypothetical protein